MGGRLIRTILENADLTHVKRLVLSPNSEQEHLRSFLEYNHWQIIDESFIKDRSKHYQMIVCEPGKMKLEDIEREFGPVIIRKKEPEFIEYLLHLIVKLENAKNNTHSAQESSRLDQRIQILKELIQ